ncbi:MAG TPA: Pr6Pr family membrane protein [Candidatus Limnocylindria bacterium]|nr:Pr6Pr family membrane protein [Candidatus Limnocylindria bacterium]
MYKHRFLTGYRLVFGLLGLSAIATEIVVLIGRGRFAPANFFSYFTIESNLFAACVLMLGGLMLARGQKTSGLGMLRGAATLYMVVTGLVFTLLLSGIEGAEFTAVPWDNIVLHYMMPVVVFADWLVDPPKSRIAFKKALVWLAFPLAYFAYSLVRGHFTDWYPYPFMNPSEKGYISVAGTGILIAAAGVGLVWLLSRVHRSNIRK